MKTFDRRSARPTPHPCLTSAGVPTAALLCTLLIPGVVTAQAIVREETRTIDTYAFSDPNPIPLLSRDARLYPYHSFDGYAAEAEPRDWKVVVLENEWIEVFVLPEVGGKVWGAIVKETGHEFIYRNEVMKFRNIALRGPWTSGGIEFNFGVIGHTPSTATPVDYVTRTNPDGSASVFVGSMDLPSRTHWRVEVRLPADAAYFETNVHWYNPTPLPQPYYNWMTAAAFARDDLVMSIPGDTYLTHPGMPNPWPIDAQGRDLAVYDENRFGPSKSYHVVGELNDFFGGYFTEAGYGFGHWSRYEEMPGQKLWLWALSREGGVWEDLLTDTDGQYVEFQAGRLLVQYSPGGEVNPITQTAFDPMSASMWSETWFPLEGTGGLSDASREGALHVERSGARATVRLNAFVPVEDTVTVTVGDGIAAREAIALRPLGLHELSVDAGAGERVRVSVPALGLDYDSDPAARDLARPFETDPEARPGIPRADRDAFEARELIDGRRYVEAAPLVASALEAEPWHREANLAASELAYRSGLYEEAVARADKVREIDAYDAAANFAAGIAYRALGRTADARDAFGWAARSTGFRSAAYAQLAEIMIGTGALAEAERYARLSVDFDRHGVPAWRALAVVARLRGDRTGFAEAVSELRAVDPLHHFALAEEYLRMRDRDAEEALLAGMGGEFPEQTLLELAIGYANVGLTEDAFAILDLPTEWEPGPVRIAWRAYLVDDPDALYPPEDLAFAHPYRPETLPVLAWAEAQAADWRWSWLYALDLWAVNRPEEAADILEGLGDAPYYAPLYAARGRLVEKLHGRSALPDLRRAVALGPDDRLMHVALSQRLIEGGLWEEALDAARAGRAGFPEDFNLALVEARALVHLVEPEAAIGIFEDIVVLPSELARGVHELYAQAHALVALDALEADDPVRARTHLVAALEWPERLGQGRPYDPDERLVEFLLAVAELALGAEEEATALFRKVHEASPDVPETHLDVLAWPARAILGIPVGMIVRPDEGSPGADLEGWMVARAVALAEKETGNEERDR